ncbi:helix-turn-helix domain-containing protein (plasmid) [Pseudomonas luteola]|uniref:helix-turn-helix domain-containing protein n=1 Tax=Pseudomonas luteola TaxID=47886 RepID=UPI003890DC73
MDKELFDDLVKSMEQMNEIIAGEREPSRIFEVKPSRVQAIRKATGLTQEKFAQTINIPVGTLRNWEQGRRDPQGPAIALLKAIEKDPKHVIAALQA